MLAIIFYDRNEWQKNTLRVSPERWPVQLTLGTGLAGGKTTVDMDKAHVYYGGPTTTLEEAQNDFELNFARNAPWRGSKQSFADL